jgi:hypothetical protein
LIKRNVAKVEIKAKEHTYMKTLRRVLFTSIGAFGLAAGLLLTGPQAAWARTKKLHSFAPVDPTLISGCGTLGASNTIYVLTNPITTTGTGDCIVLSGNNDTLDLADNDITFTGTPGTSAGAGVMITGGTDVVEGDNSTITGFAEGVVDNGANTVGDDINLISDGIGLQLSGGGFFGGTEMWTNFAAIGNTTSGVFLKSCGDECAISDFFSSNNGGDGVLITGSAGPRVSIFSSVNNGGAGVHVGCPSCSTANTSVRIGDAPVGFISGPAITGNGGDGILLDVSESAAQDQVFLTNVRLNGNGSTTFDLHDATSTCGGNHWVHNEYDTSEAGGVTNPLCIPNTPIP